MNNDNQHTEFIIEDVSTPVVILKCAHHGSLVIARSLGRLGITVYGIDSDPRSAGLFSKYFSEKYIWDIENESDQATVQFLEKIGKRVGRPSILIPTADEVVLFLYRNSTKLREWYIFPDLSFDLVQTLCSKKEMYFLAKKMGIPTAETSFPNSKNEVEKYLRSAIFPIMLKGIDGRKLELQTGKKMFITKTKEELLDLYDRYETPSSPNFMLQEYIPGGDDSVWMFNGYFNEKSECKFYITGKKIRQAPVYTGYTSLGICVKNKIVGESTKLFMKEIGYKGILDIGYRFDRRDGKYKVLDVNPRIGATFRLFVATNGMDTARAAYLDLLGKQIPFSQPIAGRKWFVEDRDVVSSIKYFHDKNLSIREWVTSFRGVQEAAWFAWDDLYPFFVMCWGFAKKIFKSRSNHQLKQQTFSHSTKIR